MSATLTPKQVETLKLISTGKVHCHRCGTAAWRILGASPTVVGRIIAAGWAEYGPFEPDDRTILITDAGRAAFTQQGEAGASS